MGRISVKFASRSILDYCYKGWSGLPVWPDIRLNSKLLFLYQSMLCIGYKPTLVVMQGCATLIYLHKKEYLIENMTLAFKQICTPPPPAKKKSCLCPRP